jgi:S1-C subfamily serine protease
VLNVPESGPAGPATPKGPVPPKGPAATTVRTAPALNVPPEPEPPRPSLRERFLPRTVIGLAVMIIAASIGAAFSGVVLYSYYQYKLQKSDDKINTFVNTYKGEFAKAQGDLAAQRDAAKAQINNELGPIKQLQATGATLQSMIKKVAPSMWFVHTLDASGQPAVGSAFAIASDQNQTLLLTSLNTVQAATKRPGPDLFIRQGGGSDVRVNAYTWDERYDLALIVLNKGNIPALQTAPASPGPAIGDQVFALSGAGSLGASASQGYVTDVSSGGLQHTAPVGQGFQGGPLLNSSGQVVGVASRNYAPLNFTSDGVWFAPFVRAACNKVLQCPGGTLSGPGSQGGG